MATSAMPGRKHIKYLSYVEVVAQVQEIDGWVGIEMDRWLDCNT